jgi:hypothetical protein
MATQARGRKNRRQILTDQRAPVKRSKLGLVTYCNAFKPESLAQLETQCVPYTSIAGYARTTPVRESARERAGEFPIREI